MLTDTPGDFVIICNVRGVETNFDEPFSYFTVKQEENWFTTIFTVIEAYFAFILAGIAILTTTYGFKWYLSPISVFFLSVFNYYVYT